MSDTGFDTFQDRYARHRLIDWWDQEKLCAAKVLVVGAGALGNEVIKNLALLGVGKMVIIDFDRVDVSNLSRSVLFRDSDLGSWKATVAAKVAKELNPDIDTEGVIGDIEFDIGVGEAKNFNVILGCLDSVNARWAVNRLSIAASVPWLNGGINPIAGEVSLFVPGEGPCYECTMTDTMWARFNERYSCTKLLKSLPPRTMPTTISLASLTAAIQVQEALMVIHHLGSRSDGLMPGQKLFVSVKPYRLFTVEQIRDPECMAHEENRLVMEVDAAPADLTATNLFLLFEKQDIKVDTMEIRFDVLAGLTCSVCGECDVCIPIKKASPSVIQCPICKSDRLPYIVNRIERGDRLSGIPLSQLGIPYQAMLTFSGGSEKYVVALTKKRGGQHGK